MFNKKDYRNIVLIELLVIVLILCFSGTDYYFGSTLDWDSQHWIFPEYLRKRFYETGEIFPSYAFEIGAGQNIYNFAYYGLLSPGQFISYLLPFVNMRNFIIGQNIFLLLLSLPLFYRFIRYHYDEKYSGLGLLVFALSTPLIFHSHRHFMFVNYMVFLLIALICVRYFYNKKRILPLMISSFMIIMTSFYFSISCFLVIILYATMLYLEDRKFEIRDYIKYIWKIILSIIVAVLMAAVLLLPTAYALLSGRDKSGGSFDFMQIIPGLHGEFFFFDSYSVGLPSVTILFMIWIFKNRKKGMKLVAAIFMGSMIFPVFVLALNGFMYLNGKVLIPVLPIAVLLVIEFFKAVKEEEVDYKGLSKIAPIVYILLIILTDNILIKIAILAEGIILIFVFWYQFKKKNLPVFMYYTIFVLFLSTVVLNFNDKMPKKDLREDKLNYTIEKMVKNAIKEDKAFYRFANEYDMRDTVNRTYGKGYYQNTVYSSVSNKSFSDFYYNQMCNENSYRNAALMSQSKNVLFNMYMNTKYILSESAYIPVGYKKIAEDNHIYLYRNDNVYPLGYANDRFMKRSEYNQLKYPYNIEALMEYSIIEDKYYDQYKLGDKGRFIPTIIKYSKDLTISSDNKSVKKIRDNYHVDTKNEIDTTIKLPEVAKNKIFFIRFTVDNNLPGIKKDVSVTLNGIRNRLTAPGWTYHNKNYSFEYVISSNEEFDEIDVKLSEGNYIISNIETYVLDYKNVLDSSSDINEYKVDRKKTKGDKIFGKIDCGKNEWFNISIPYDEGYSVYIDGEKTKIHKTDIDFIGFYIEKGSHDVLIKYQSPFLREGKIISLAGVLAFLTIAIYEISLTIKNKKSKRKTDEEK